MVILKTVILNTIAVLIGMLIINIIVAIRFINREKSINKKIAHRHGRHKNK